MSTYEPGHGPTSTDYAYATQYANDVMNKAACLAQPDKYTWVPSSVTRYPCPEGVECESGVCKFQEDACRERSELPYYDCVRRPVSCDTHPSGVCEICDYSISLGRKITGPYTTGDVPDGCTAGDPKYTSDVQYPTPLTTPVLSLSGFCDHDDQCTPGSSCVMPEPDEVLEHWGMACTTADECGGRSVCASGHCVSDTAYEGMCVVQCTTSDDCFEADPLALCGQDPEDAALYGRCYIPSEPVDTVCDPSCTTSCSTSDDCAGMHPLAVCEDGECHVETSRGTKKRCRPSCVSACNVSTDCEVGVCGEDPNTNTGRCYIPTPATTLCQPYSRNHEPYTVRNYEDDEIVSSPVSCETDEHCLIPPGVGGVCGRDPSLPTYGYCYDPSLPPYLEWRDEITMWDDMPPSKNICIETHPSPRKWCEMPWTRATPDEDNPTDPLSVRVKRGWKSRARPPFMYDERDASCHVTKEYCTANLKNGGFSAGYGRSHDFWLGSTCGGTTDAEVVGAYDCCTKLGDSIGEFFLGRTLTTDFRELVEGDTAGFGSRWQRYMERLAEKTEFKLGPVRGNAVTGLNGQILRAGDPGLAQTLDFVCDPRLKQGIRRIATNVIGPGIPIHGYAWEWSALATRLYGFEGTDRGMLTTEVERVFPHMVKTETNGYHYISITPSLREDRRVYDGLVRLKIN